jgi:hypothetical protein
MSLAEIILGLARGKAKDALTEAGREFNKKPARRRPRWVIVLTFVLLASIFPALTAYISGEYLRVRDWPGTTAVVLANSVEAKKDFLKNETRYSGQVNYAYFYGDRKLMGDIRVDTAYNYGEINLAPGSRLTVYYNPGNPAESVTDKSLLGVLICSGFSLLVFIAIPGEYKKELRRNGYLP